MEIVKFDLKYKNELLDLDKECFGVNHWDNELWEEILGDLEHNIIYLFSKTK